MGGSCPKKKLRNVNIEEPRGPVEVEEKLFVGRSFAPKQRQREFVCWEDLCPKTKAEII